MKADQQITDTCSCGASFGVTGQYLSDMRASHKEWLDRHTACRLSPLASASRENEMSAADRYHAQTGLDLPAEGQSHDQRLCWHLEVQAVHSDDGREAWRCSRCGVLFAPVTPDGPSADRIEKLEQALNILCISAGIHAWGRDDSPKRQERLETLRGDIQEARFVLTGSPGWEPSSVTEPVAECQHVFPTGSSVCSKCGHVLTVECAADDASPATRSCDSQKVHAAHEYKAVASHETVERLWHCPGRQIIRGNGRNMFDALEAGVYPMEEIMASPGPLMNPSQSDDDVSDGRCSEPWVAPNAEGEMCDHYCHRGKGHPGPHVCSVCEATSADTVARVAESYEPRCEADNQVWCEYQKAHDGPHSFEVATDSAGDSD